jgi:hypothetical protein
MSRCARRNLGVTLLTGCISSAFISASGAEDLAPSALNSYTALPAKFLQAKVYQQDGTILGDVLRIEYSAGYQKLVIRTGGNKEIALSGAEASYDEGLNVLVVETEAVKRGGG